MKKSNCSGFTLIELMIVVAILGIIVVSSSAYFEGYNNAYKNVKLKVIGYELLNDICETIENSDKGIEDIFEEFKRDDRLEYFIHPKLLYTKKELKRNLFNYIIILEFKGLHQETRKIELECIRSEIK